MKVLAVDVTVVAAKRGFEEEVGYGKSVREQNSVLAHLLAHGQVGFAHQCRLFACSEWLVGLLA